jgi:ribosomal protein S7
VTQLVNKILLDGKKSIAESIVYGALEGCREKTGTDPVVTLKRALDNIKPAARGQVPPRRWRDLPGARRGQARPATTLALRWLVGYSRQRREKTMTERLMNELLDAATVSAPRSSAARTPTRWPSPTRPSPTTAGDHRGSGMPPARPRTRHTTAGAGRTSRPRRAPNR